MSNWLLVLPVLDPHLGETCLASMVGLDPRRIILVDNTRRGFTYPGVKRIRPEPGGNIGVSKSWNLGARRVVDEGRDDLVICSSAIRFGELGGADLCERLDDTADMWGMEVDNAVAWHLIVFSRATLLKVGYFDEQFYPGYWNDTDYLYRMGLAGLPSPRENGRWMARTTLDLEDRGSALGLKGKLVHADMAAEGAKYRAKWGGDQGSETFTVPYNQQRGAVPS